MWKAIITATALFASQALAQAPAASAADLSPYVAALKAAAAYLPGASKKSLHLANYDDASHKALAREVFTASVFGGLITPATHLNADGSLIPTGVRWTERHYLFASDNQCEVFINVRDLSSSIALAVPDHASFSVWHELAHCMMLELMDASAAAEGGQKALAQRVVARLSAALPSGRGKFAYTMLNEAFADTFALLVQASVHGNAAARDMGWALLDFRRQEHAAHEGKAGAGEHDTSNALGLALSVLGAYDLSELTTRDRYLLAMNIAVDGTLQWAEDDGGAQAGAALKSVLRQLERSLLQTAATAAQAARPAAAMPVYLDFPGTGKRISLRLM